MALDGHAAEVAPNLFLGPWSSGSNGALLTMMGITHILNVSGVKNSCIIKHPTITTLFLPVEDSDDQALTHLFPQSNTFIHQARSRGCRVLVHCAAGISRSASFVLAYLMRHEGLTYDEALALVKLHRPICQPNRNFERQLRDYGQSLLPPSS